MLTLGTKPCATVEITAAVGGTEFRRRAGVGQNNDLYFDVARSFGGAFQNSGRSMPAVRFGF